MENTTTTTVAPTTVDEAIFKPSWLPPAVLSMGAMHLSKLIEVAKSDAHFLRVYNLLADKANGAARAMEAGESAAPEAMEAMALVQMTISMGPDFARANLLVYSPPKERASAKAKSDPWLRQWERAVASALIEVLDKAAWQNIVALIRRATLSKGVEGAIPNAGVPAAVKDLLTAYDAASTDDLRDDVRVKIMQAFAHSQGSATVLKRAKGSPTFPAINPVTGEPTQPPKKDGSISEVGVSFGFRADGIRPTPKAKKTEGKATDTTTPEKVTAAAPPAA